LVLINSDDVKRHFDGIIAQWAMVSRVM